MEPRVGIYILECVSSTADINPNPNILLTKPFLPQQFHILKLLSRIIQNKTTMAAAAADKTKAYFPLAGSANDGWSNEDEATATCFCGAVQLAFVSLVPKSARLSKLV
jgi:hypothetical protein